MIISPHLFASIISSKRPALAYITNDFMFETKNLEQPKGVSVFLDPIFPYPSS